MKIFKKIKLLVCIATLCVATSSIQAQKYSQDVNDLVQAINQKDSFKVPQLIASLKNKLTGTEFADFGLLLDILGNQQQRIQEIDDQQAQAEQMLSGLLGGSADLLDQASTGGFDGLLGGLGSDQNPLAEAVDQDALKEAIKNPETMRAWHKQQVDVRALLQQKFDLNAVTIEDKPLLHYAYQYGYLETIQEFLLEDQTSLWRLFPALISGQSLVEYPVDLAGVDELGNTVLHYAAQKCNLADVRFFIGKIELLAKDDAQKTGLLNVRNLAGQTALDIALLSTGEAQDRNAIVSLLQGRCDDTKDLLAEDKKAEDEKEVVTAGDSAQDSQKTDQEKSEQRVKFENIFARISRALQKPGQKETVSQEDRVVDDVAAAVAPLEQALEVVKKKDRASSCNDIMAPVNEAIWKVLTCENKNKCKQSPLFRDAFLERLKAIKEAFLEAFGPLDNANNVLKNDTHILFDTILLKQF